MRPPAGGIHPGSVLTPGADRFVSSGEKLFDSRIGSFRIDGWPDCLPDVLRLAGVQSPIGRRVVCWIGTDQRRPT